MLGLTGYIIVLKSAPKYYISVAKRKNDLKGVGPFIMASVEYERATGQ